MALAAAGAGPVQAQMASQSTYRAPTLVLVQPVPGGLVPQDRPVIVLRATQGEVADPLDAQTLMVIVDGVDRTALFQMSATPVTGATGAITEAWGPLAAPNERLAPGTHQVEVRLCSVRGVCATSSASVAVVPATGFARIAAPEVASASASRSRRVFGALVSITRKILTP